MTKNTVAKQSTSEFHLVAIRDGFEVLNKHYINRASAVKAYDRIIINLSVGPAQPKQTGVVALYERPIDRICSDTLMRSSWKQGFGWY